MLARSTIIPRSDMSTSCFIYQIEISEIYVETHWFVPVSVLSLDLVVILFDEDFWVRFFGVGVYGFGFGGLISVECWLGFRVVLFGN